MAGVHPAGLFEARVDGTRSPPSTIGCGSPRRQAACASSTTRIATGSVFGALDAHLLAEGTHYRAYDALGARVRSHGGTPGVQFAVWAPNAARVSVVGDFNGWDGRVHAMRLLAGSGVWEIFIPGLTTGPRYKFEVVDARGRVMQKSDPYGRAFEAPPDTASVVWQDAATYGPTPSGWPRAALEHAADAGADVDLRSASRIVEARRPRRAHDDVSRDGGDAGAVRARARASPTSSCCR